MSLLIKNVLLKGKKIDLYIKDGKIEKIALKINKKADKKIDGQGQKAVLPGLINCHTHTAMTLFRGYGDDLPLKDWLEKKIWPLEQKISADDVYWGTKLACLEMIKTGTTCFNDMYWFEEASVEAVKEMGLRGVIGLVLLDFDPKGTKENLEKFWNIFQKREFKTVSFSIAPHAIYTVCQENLIWAKNFAQKNNLTLHIHLSETKKEVKDCLRRYKVRPVEYLDKIGLLNRNCVLAHSIWLSDKEIKILARRKCNIVYNPVSNMKLASGIFPYSKLKKAKVNICLGTDGAASNNNLDLFEEMKIGSLLQKVKEASPVVVPAPEIFKTVTKNGAQALKMKIGQIRPGNLADLILLDLNQACFTPGHNLISDVVYSCQGDCVSDVICHGKILMRDRKVRGERRILQQTRKKAKKLVSLVK
ncbi:amidohydrolase [Patescibacteria group bacterium]|nr:amidohydrolase [Patescibacteria group bacterium]